MEKIFNTPLSTFINISPLLVKPEGTSVYYRLSVYLSVIFCPNFENLFETCCVAKYKSIMSFVKVDQQMTKKLILNDLLFQIEFILTEKNLPLKFYETI